jgi:hypothetical protein
LAEDAGRATGSRRDRHAARGFGPLATGRRAARGGVWGPGDGREDVRAVRAVKMCGSVRCVGTQRELARRVVTLGPRRRRGSRASLDETADSVREKTREEGGEEATSARAGEGAAVDLAVGQRARWRCTRASPQARGLNLGRRGSRREWRGRRVGGLLPRYRRRRPGVVGRRRTGRLAKVGAREARCRGGGATPTEASRWR